MPTFTPYVEEEKKNKFTPYVEAPKFTAYEPEKPVFTPLEKEVNEQVFTPYFEPYDMAPPQIRDMAKIMGSVAEAPKEPVMGLEYIPAKVYSYLVEEPLANAGALVSQGLEKGFRFLGMDKLADTQAEVTENYKAPPVTEKVKEQTAYLRQSAYKKGQAQGIIYDITEAGTRFGSLLVQMGALKTLPALKGGEIGKRMGTLGVHGFLTAEGDLKERFDAAQYRIAYASTPFLAQHWGATGIKSIAIDAMLNTMLTTPFFVKSYNQAKKTGRWDGFISDVITQMTLNVGMAVTTTGYPKAQMEAKMKSYLKTTARKMDISYKDLESIVKSYDKAQNPKTPLQKAALAKQEKTLQTLMQKDDANIELEKLAADEKNSPINKMIQQAENPSLTANELSGYKNANDFINSQKSYYHGTSKRYAESIRKEGVTPGMASRGDIGINQVGFSISPDKGVAKEFAYKDGEILEFKLLPNAKIANPENLKGAMELFQKWEDGKYLFNQYEMINLAKEQGFDGIDLTRFNVLMNPKRVITEVQIWNADIIKTKEQLSELYNQAKGVGVPIQDKINNLSKELSTNSQKAKVHIRAKELGLLTPKDKEKQVYQTYMESLVGEKSTKNMNQGQIKMVIDNLDKMDIRTADRLSKTKVKNITPALLRFVTGLGELQDIGFKEKFRNPYEVFSKMGLVRQVYLPSRDAEIDLYNDEMVYRTELKKLLHQKGITKDSRQKVFDAIESPATEGIKTYHTGTKPFDKNIMGKDGIFVTPDKSFAERWKDSQKYNVFEELIISKDAKILKRKDIPSKFITTKNSVNSVSNQSDVIKYAKNKGYDGYEDYAIDTKTNNIIDREMAIWNKDKIITEKEIDLNPSEVKLRVKKSIISEIKSGDVSKDYVYHLGSNIEGIIGEGLKTGGISGFPILEKGYGRVLHVFNKSDIPKGTTFGDVTYQEILGKGKWKPLKPIASFDLSELKINYDKLPLGNRAMEEGYEEEPYYKPTLKELKKEKEFIKGIKSEISKAYAKEEETIVTKKTIDNLNPSEIKLRDFAVKFFDDWANKLKLPPEKRRDKYVTHIFEKALNNMTDKGYVDPNILRAFEFGAIPKSIKNPFIQNERTGQEYGLKRDVVEAMNVYEAYALRTFHYEPLLNKMDMYSKFLPDLSRKYLGNYAGRMSNRPLDVDKGINNNIRELTKVISESPLARAPAFKKLLPLLKDQTQGNIAGTAAYYYTGMLYETALGMRPDSAIRNLGQGVLTIAESGLGNYVKGLGFLTTKEGREALHKSKVFQSRKYAYLPSQGGFVPQNIVGNVKNAMMYMFKTADKFNVSTAFSTGYQEAKSLGVPDPIAIERGDEVAEKTQYMYTKMAAPEFSMSVPGKVLGVFTSWPRNWFELTGHWIRGDISEVYLNYEKQTGKKVYKEDWASRHRAAMTYAAIYALSMYIEQKTDIKATQYTGFRTIETIPRYLSGNIAGLRLPLALSQIAVGSAMGDKSMLEAGVKGVNPMTWFNALRKLDDINSGKKDWLDLYLYRNKKKFRLR